MTSEGKKRGNLVRFHSEHKLQILSHSDRHLRLMGKLVARAKEIAPAELFSSYEGLFLEALGLRATVRKNLNVLQHILGYFKKEIDADEKQEVLEILERYRKGFVPLVVPVTLLNHYVRKYDQPYLRIQHYLQPHPVELALRNHV